MSIGTRIKEARKKLKITQSELAKKTHLSRSHIGAIECDKYNPSISTLEAIANALNTPIETFVSDDDNKELKIDEETQALAKEIKSNPDFRIILNIGKQLKPSALNEVKHFMEFQLQKTKNTKRAI